MIIIKLLLKNTCLPNQTPKKKPVRSKYMKIITKFDIDKNLEKNAVKIQIK